MEKNQNKRKRSIKCTGTGIFLPANSKNIIIDVDASTEEDTSRKKLFVFKTKSFVNLHAQMEIRKVIDLFVIIYM